MFGFQKTQSRFLFHWWSGVGQSPLILKLRMGLFSEWFSEQQYQYLILYSTEWQDGQ
jgi:hypothetical protein